MMVWNKTPEDKVKQIINVIKTTDKLSREIAEEFNVSSWLVEEIARNNLSKSERREIWTKRARRSKMGVDNPMHGITGKNHHNAVETSRCRGYKTVFKPDWYKGDTKDSRIYEHTYVFCKENNMSCVPKGHIIHHIDGDIDNNDISNLQMLTVSEHVKLHWRQRKEQRSSRNGVGNSIPEAQGNLNKVDDMI